MPLSARRPTPPDVDLTIVIVNWNTKRHLRRCLETIFRPSVETRFEVIVVDNASRDGSADMAEVEFPQTNVIRNERNLGFAKAANQAIILGRGNFFLLLNPDAALQENAIDRAVEFAREHPDIGIVGCKILNEDGTLQHSCRRFPTPAVGLFRNTVLGRLFPRNRYLRAYLMTDWDHRHLREVDWVSGACMLIRREALSEVGILDERYFMYCEDLDLCFRAHNAGWKVFYYPRAAAVHRKGASSDQAQVRCVVAFHKSLYKFFNKYFAKARFLPYRWLVGLLLVIRATAIIVKYGIRKSLASLRAGRAAPE
jgi:GT2 family glycosyltransferase